MKVKRIQVLALSGLAIILATVPAHAQMSGNGPDNWMGGWGWGHTAFGSVMMMLGWGVLAVAIALLVRSVGTKFPKTKPPPSASNALAILEKRFARGEIDKEEYDKRKRLLSS